MSRIDDKHVRDERTLPIGEHYANMAMSSPSDIVVDRFRVGLDFVLKLVESFEGCFATDWSEVGSLEEGVLVIDITCYCGWR